MRVLFVNHTGEASGAEIAMLRLIRSLADDVECAVASPPGRLAGMVADAGVTHLPLEGTSLSFRLSPRETSAGLLEVIRSGVAVGRLARAWKADVIHANSPRAGLMCLMAGLGSTPVVLQVHDVLPPSRLSRVVRQLLSARITRIRAVSAAAAGAFNDGLAGAPAAPVHISIDHDRFHPDPSADAAVRESLGVGPDTPFIGVVAQITPWKGQLTAVEAMPLIRRQHPDARLALVGGISFAGSGGRYDNAAYLRQLHERVAALGLQEAVLFAGHRADVPELMRALDVMLLPSAREPFGTSCAEAMACGTVPVVSDDGGPAEFVEDMVSGRVVPAADTEAWARAVTELLSDPDERKRIGRRARAVAEQFTDQAYAENFLAVYRDVLPTRRRRVLFVNHTEDFSGAEVALLRLLRALPAGTERAVACPPQGPFAEAVKAAGVTILPIPGTAMSFRLDLRQTPAGLWALVRSAYRLRGHIRGYQPQIVHASGTRAGLIAMLGRRRRPPALVLQQHDVLPSGRLGSVVRMLLARGTDAVVGVSEMATAEFARGVSGVTASTIVASIDHDRFRPDGHDLAAVRASLGVPADVPLVGVVAQITPWKGQHIAVEALALLRESVPEAHLVLVGEVAFSHSTRYDNQAYLAQLRGRVAELRLESVVHFAGFRDDVEAVMATLDLVLLPSTKEPFGLVVVEAMACGTVPLVSDDGGSAEIVQDGVTGRVLPPLEPAAWAAAMDDLLTDPERRTTFAAHAVRAAARYRDDLHVSAYEDLYERLAAGA